MVDCLGTVAMKELELDTDGVGVPVTPALKEQGL